MPDWFLDPGDRARSSALQRFIERAEGLDVSVQRTVPKTLAPTDHAWRGWAEQVEITGEPGIHLSGMGFLDPVHAEGWLGRLWATVLVLDDGQGGRVAIVAFDLHVASRPIVERIAARVGPLTGIGIDRIFPTAIHTHYGPGNFYGDDFYDRVAGGDSGFRTAYVETVVAAVSEAIERGAERIDEGTAPLVRVGFGADHHWGLAYNRSLVAFAANFAEEIQPLPETAADCLLHAAVLRARAAEVNGVAPPASEGAEGYFGAKTAVDARVRVLWVESADGATPLCGLAFFSATPTFLGGGARTMTGDVVGTAAALVRVDLRNTLSSDAVVPFALAGSAFGDAGVSDNRPFATFDADRDAVRRFSQPAPWELHTLETAALFNAARALGDTILGAWSAARADAAAGGRSVGHRLETRFAELEISEIPGEPAPDGLILAKEFQVGVAGLAGAEVDHTKLQDLFKVKESRRDEDNEDPAHRPKLDARKTIAGSLAQLLTAVTEPSPLATLRILRIGSLTLAAVPGEPTTWLAHRIEGRLGGSANNPVIVAGLAGDYLGYLVTRAEYETQQYEGGGCLWGRDAGEWMIRAVHALAYSEQLPMGQQGGVRLARAPFTTAPDPDIRSRFEVFPGTIGPDNPTEPLHAMLPPRVVESGGRRWLALEGRWAAPALTELPPLRGPWVRVLVRPPGAAEWRILRVGRTQVNDASWPMLVRREQKAVESFARYRFFTRVPLDSAWNGARFAFDVPGPTEVRPIRWARPETSPVEV